MRGEGVEKTKQWEKGWPQREQSHGPVSRRECGVSGRKNLRQDGAELIKWLRKWERLQRKEQRQSKALGFKKQELCWMDEHFSGYNTREDWLGYQQVYKFVRGKWSSSQLWKHETRLSAKSGWSETEGEGF